MTYCVGIEVDDGLVFAADTRTSGSFDDVRVHRDLDDARDRSLRTFTHLVDVAEYVGETLVASQAKVAEGAQPSGVNLQATLILGGQIAGELPGLCLIYPLGNCIASSPETPYLQIGESKYGKPILDRILRPATTMEDAARCALVSLDSTIRSNLSVGMPIDMTLVRADELRITQQMRFESDTPLFAEIHDTWSRKLEAAIHSLPRFPWEPPRREQSHPVQMPIPPARVASRQD